MQDKSLLYIEDNVLNVRILEMMVRALWNSPLESALTAEAGLERMRQSPVDLVYMDINLPGMSGIEATRLIKQSDDLCHIPVVAVTADASPQTVARFEACGGRHFLVKPVDADMFRRVTEAALATAGGGAGGGAGGDD